MCVIGTCHLCGGNIVEKEDKYECEYQDNQYAHTCIWKNALHRFGGANLDVRDAKMLCSGCDISVQLKSRRTGRWYRANVYYDTTSQQIKLVTRK